MPDLAMCPSTVCSVRKLCMRNWDSGCYTPDLDPKIQKWVPRHTTLGVGYESNSQPEDCDMYKPVHHFPKDSSEDLWKVRA